MAAGSLADLYGSTLDRPQQAAAEQRSAHTPLGLISVTSPVLEWLKNPISMLVLALLAALGWLVAITRTGDPQGR